MRRALEPQFDLRGYFLVFPGLELALNYSKTLGTICVDSRHGAARSIPNVDLCSQMNPCNTGAQ
jgi:hypothetical protein